MNRATAAIFGLVPAAFMTVMALAGIGFVDGWRMLLAPAAVVGFIGMAWAFSGQPRHYWPLLTFMLVIGEVAMAWGLLTQIVGLASPNKAIGWKFFSIWATLGPCVVGAAYLWRSLRRRPAAVA